MSWVDEKTGEKKYTLKEKQDYHNRQAKIGATKFDKITKRMVKVSDFERGAHKAMANMIFEKRKHFAMRMANQPKQSNYSSKKKVVKGVPAWYNDYLKDRLSNKKPTIHYVKTFDELKTSNDVLVDSFENYFK